MDYLTTDTLFEINELPKRLAVLGGGAAGVEIAQAFARLGSKVTLVTRDDQLLAEFDRDAAKLLQKRLNAEGVTIHTCATIRGVRECDQAIEVEIAGDNDPFQIEADRLFLATGRTAMTSGLDLESAGVDFERHGIPVDAYCRTTMRHILASGDVTTAPNLTHVAENMSKAAAFNAVARIPIWKHEQSIIPMVVYTDPEIASVGRGAQELESTGEAYDVIDLPYEKIDRAMIEGQCVGFIRVYHRFGRILGATIAGAQAGELISEYALAMRHGLRLPALSGTLHAYPTMMVGARRAADQWYAHALRPWMIRGVRFFYGYRGAIPDYIGKRVVI